MNEARSPVQKAGQRHIKNTQGTSLAVQWLELHASTAGGAGLIPVRGTKIPQATRHNQLKKKKKTPVMGHIFYPGVTTLSQPSGM